MGNLLQRENHPNRGRDNQMDKARPNRDLGMVRDRFDASLEKPFSTHGDKQEVGVAADERRSMGDHSEPLVEIPNRQTSSADHSSDQLRTVSNRIKGASFRKISGGGRSRVDAADHHGEEDTLEQADRMLDDGESSQGEIDAIRGACDQPDHSHQSFTEHDGGNQTLSHLAQGETGAEDGTPGSMEVEGH